MNRAVSAAATVPVAGRRARVAVKRLFIALTVAAALAAAAGTAPSAANDIDATAEVLRIVDGDTIDIRDDNRGRLRVRVLGIDTPETQRPGYTVGCWGPEATELARSTLLGQRVALQLDPTQDRTDRFGRTLAYLVRADGWDYSVEAARAGTAKSYVYGGSPVSRHGAILAAESDAKNAGRGLWGPPCNGDTSSTATDAQPRSATPVAPPASGNAAPRGLYEAPAPSSNVYYDNCTAARAAGAAPIVTGQPGYRSGLDRDGDGIACE